MFGILVFLFVLLFPVRVLVLVLFLLPLLPFLVLIAASATLPIWPPSLWLDLLEAFLALVFRLSNFFRNDLPWLVSTFRLHELHVLLASPVAAGGLIVIVCVFLNLLFRWRSRSIDTQVNTEHAANIFFSSLL